MRLPGLKHPNISPALGPLSRTTSTRTLCGRKARRLAYRSFNRDAWLGPQVRGEPARPTTAGRLARVPGLSSLRETSEHPKTLTGIVYRDIQRRVPRRVRAFFAGYPSPEVAPNAPKPRRAATPMPAPSTF